MLDDRSYMQSSYEPAKRYPAVVVLMGVCGVVFLLQLLTRTPGFPSLWDKYFFLSQVGVGSGFLWQLITFQFIHGDVLHLLFNGLSLIHI